MGNNKLLKVMLIILISLTLGGVVTLVLVNYFKEPDPNVAPTIDEIIAHSYETEEITTNLHSNDFIKASFKIQVDNKKAFKEIEKRDFQVNNIIIRTLAGTDASALSGSEGIEALESTIRDQLNEVMQDGKVVQVYTTSWAIQ